MLIKDLNPMMIFHNWGRGDRANSLLSIELDVNPWRYINIYGQVAVDELTLSIEQERLGGYRVATALGKLAGLEFTYPLGPGYLSLIGEYVVIDPWMYNRDGAPYWTNVRKITKSAIQTDPYHVLKPFGYETGPDSIVGFVALKYAIFDFLTCQLDVKFITKGEKELDSAYDPVLGEQTPTGIPENKRILHFHIEFSPWFFLEVGSDLYWINILNSGHVPGAQQDDLEWAAFVKLKI